MPYAVETRALTKVYPPRRSLRRLGRPVEPPKVAVQDVSLRISQGEIFGLLGPNGAGKTTLIKMLSTLLVPTRGEARVVGLDLREEQAIKARIGFVTPGERSFYWRLTGLENLEFFAALQGFSAREARARSRAVLAQVGLQDAAHQRVGEYSTGMHKRLAIARALLHSPALLFLDEPTSGLDPQASMAFHVIIRRLAAEGKTLLLSTHDLSEAEKLCNRVAILHHGRLHAIGTVAELRRALPWKMRYHIQVRDLPQSSRQKLVTYLGDLSPAQDAPPEITFTLENPEDLPFVLAAIPPQHLNALIPVQPSLEQIFDHSLKVPPQVTVPPPFDEDAVVLDVSSPGRRVTALRAVFQKFGAFLRRDWRIERSYRLAFLLQLARMAFSVGIFYFIGQLVNFLDLDLLRTYGDDYFAFVLIGLAMRGYFGTALTSFSQSIRVEQTTGTLEAMLTTPARLETVIFGSALWNYLMTSFNLLLYLLAGVLLGRLHLAQANLSVAALGLLFSLVTYSSLGVLSASFTMLYKRGDPVTWAFQALSDFLGGLYYPTEVLPAGLQVVAAFLPVTYSLRVMRLALLQGASWAAVWPDMAVLAAFAALVLPLSILAFRFAVRRVRIQGSLVGY